MSSKFLLLFSIFYLSVILCKAAPTQLNPSDLEIGDREPGDKLLFTMKSMVFSNPGSVDNTENGISTAFVKITYVKVVESGQYPGARATLVSGGPGSNHMKIRTSKGTSPGFDYEISVYGIELPSN